MGVKLSKDGLLHFVSEVEARLPEPQANVVSLVKPKKSSAPYSGDGRPPKPKYRGKDSVTQLARAIARDQAMMERYIYDAAWVETEKHALHVLNEQAIRLEARAKGLGLTMPEGMVQEIVSCKVGGVDGFTVRSEARIGEEASKELVLWTPGRIVPRKPMGAGWVHENDVIAGQPVNDVSVTFSEAPTSEIVL